MNVLQSALVVAEDHNSENEKKDNKTRTKKYVVVAKLGVNKTSVANSVALLQVSFSRQSQQYNLKRVSMVLLH